MKKIVFMLLCLMVLTEGSTARRTDVKKQVYALKDSARTVPPTEWCPDYQYSYCEAMVEVPDVKGVVKDSIVAWINARFENEGPVIYDIDKLIRQRFKRFHDQEAEERAADEGGPMNPYSYGMTITIDTISADYISLIFGLEEYYGGAHGSFIFAGSTFRRSDGKELLWTDYFDDPEAIRPYLTDAFDNGDRDVCPEWDIVYDFTQTTEDTYPIPNCDPWITKGNKMSFMYQQYEIGPYAMGMPTCDIPISKIRHLIKPALRKILCK